MKDINEPVECPSPGCSCDGAYPGEHESVPYSVERLQMNHQFMGITMLRPGPWQEPWFQAGASKSLMKVGSQRRIDGTHNRWQ